jgi:mono/diheme cytochrome c family protein
MPSAITNRAEMRTVSREQFQKELAGGLICLTCHQLEGQGGEVGIELASVGYRLRPEWVREYLVAPARFGVAPAAMPPQFYQLTDDGKSFRETTTRAAERIGVIADYLCSLNTARREALGKKYANAKAAWPHAEAVLGETLFRSLNCAACHRHHAIAPRPQPAAPDLSGEGLRVNRAWLDAYLKQPRALRPFGHQPGDGSRMPDFRLSDDEATELSAFLSAQKPKAQTWPDVFRPQPMTAFAQQKAKLLLTEKLSCLGCHTFGGPGGRIGPDLAAARERLQPDYLYGIITNPRVTTPHAMMPRVPMPEDTARLLANYLWQQTNAPAPAKHLSAADHPVIPSDESATNSGANAEAVRRAYLTFCAPCHGASGQGDGFNARYLPVKPTAHADARHLSTRPDDTLYDGIHAGGYILNKSHLMPPWGATFSPKQIRELVAHLRTLCQCQGPAWSRDDARALNK